MKKVATVSKIEPKQLRRDIKAATGVSTTVAIDNKHSGAVRVRIPYAHAYNKEMQEKLEAFFVEQNIKRVNMSVMNPFPVNGQDYTSLMCVTPV